MRMSHRWRRCAKKDSPQTSGVARQHPQHPNPCWPVLKQKPKRMWRMSWRRRSLLLSRVIRNGGRKKFKEEEEEDALSIALVPVILFFTPPLDCVSLSRNSNVWQRYDNSCAKGRKRFLAEEGWRNAYHPETYHARRGSRWHRKVVGQNGRHLLFRVFRKVLAVSMEQGRKKKKRRRRVTTLPLGLSRRYFLFPYPLFHHW